MPADDQLDQLENIIKKIEPFSTTFSQEYFDAFQGKTIQSKGLLKFMQPGLMAWSYQEPEEMLFVVGKEFAWLYDPIMENVTIQELDKISGIKSMRFLSKDENISQHFITTTPQAILVEVSEGQYAMFLKPVQPNPSLAELQIVFDPAKSEIRQFVIIDHNSSYRRVTFEDVKQDPTLNVSDFEFIVTEDMEVIQGIGN
ncbi:outer membrane lipoprotein carrier protein LolA [bacterium]|nr:outer membrane lipoprotein carrier protein LolA [bacterium]